MPPIVIDAFVGAEVPPEYAQTRYDLVTLLKEFDAATVYPRLEELAQIEADIVRELAIRPAMH